MWLPLWMAGLGALAAGHCGMAELHNKAFAMISRQYIAENVIHFIFLPSRRMTKKSKKSLADMAHTISG